MSSGDFNQISSLNEDAFTKLHHYGPCTSLRIHKNYIFAGYGPTLKVFEVNSTTNNIVEIYSKQQFKRNKIHHIGISPSGNYMVINGGRSFAVISIADLLLDPRYKSTEKAINEWITTTSFLNDNELLVLNSHNTIYKVNITDQIKYALVEKIHCQEKSILYSGSITTLSDGTTYIAAGTVMSGILIWNLNTREIVHSLTKHEGSIFGVKIDASGKYIISCSDDRSIILYDFKTGDVLATGWGHGSRIWNLEFFKGDENEVRIMSCGEDCTLRLWKYEQSNAQLQQLECWENCHRGKHIWLGDADDVNLKICVTGGADGRVRVHDLDSESSLRREYSMADIENSIGAKFKKNVFIRDYFEFTELGLWVLLTSNGEVIKFDEIRKSYTKIEFDDGDKFNNFGIVKGFDDINIVLIASRNGDILVLDFHESSDPQISWIKDDHLGNNKLTNLLVYSNKGRYFVFSDCANPNIPFTLRECTYDEGLKVANTKQFRQPNQTRFTTTDMTIDDHNNWLIIASRYVSLAVFDLDSPDSISLFKKISPGDTITSVQVIHTEKDSIHLLILVKDGVYIYAKLSKTDSSFELTTIHQNKLTRGFVEGGFIDNNQHLILYGFKSSYFYVWNETLQIEIMNELCGGGNRNWKFSKCSSGGYKFIYINRDSLWIRQYNGRFMSQNYGLIQLGTHGREIRDVSISPLLPNGDRLLATASEDATVAISKLTNDGRIIGYWNMNNHISGLQRVKFINGEYLASSAANEEFLIWKLDWFGQVPMVKEVARMKTGKDIPDLRVMDFCVVEGETDGEFVVATVFSDSNIKVWLVVNGAFKLILADRYTTCCILNVDFLKFKNRLFLQIGTTDGHITIWEVSRKLDNISSLDGEVQKFDKMLINQQLHQNGIKSFEIFPIGDGEYRLVTGGDDNALIVSKISLESDNELKLQPLAYEADAASATITSISKIGERLFVATSVDQIVRLWSFDDDRLTCKSAAYTTVADTGCCDSAKVGDSQMVVIGGAGISTWKC